jgi:hypothetical protein
MANKRDQLLTVAQVLALLGDVSPRTFYLWRETGRAPGAVLWVPKTYATRRYS